jgi:hypothetical protein
VGVSHLVQHDQRTPVVTALFEQVAKPDILERIDLGHQPLVRCIAGHKPGEVSHLGKGDRDDGRNVERGKRLARRPELAHGAFRVGERGCHRMPPPETRAADRGLGGAVSFACHQSSSSE